MILCLIGFSLFVAVRSVNASPLGEIVDVYGDRNNQLVGYGVVVGLDGTGDKSQVKFTQQSVANMVKQFGVQLEGSTDPKLKNVASVIVTAQMSPYSAPGQTLDLTVSSIGDASSLVGGTLLLTQLRGIDGEVYAVGQGNVVVGGYKASGNDGSSITKNIPTVGKISNGAIVERHIDTPEQATIVLNLKKPNYRTSLNISKKLNQIFGDGVAKSVSKGTVVVESPSDRASRVSFLSMIQELDVEEGRELPKVVFNARTGTVVISQGVTVSKAAVSQGGLVVRVGEDFDVVQPVAFAEGETQVIPSSNMEVRELDSGMMVWPDGVNLQDIVDSVNAVGASPESLMQILQALDEAGALHGELVVI
ncbi:flagellar basal body P-ring protein FlgI [Vibrio owensii]|uniref:flagellar basal body P-ring protein FlgI n=1 Tax=Vibrio owensii TaxID=696485 RepID=UPI0024559588|nr:flagellar basal body P-ring protein FlgI [Vibrio owensii]